MIFGKEGKGKQAESRVTLTDPSLQALPASWRDLIQCLRDSYFASVGAGVLRAIMEICGVMSALCQCPGIFEHCKDAKCKTHHWVEWVRTCGLCMWFCFLLKGGKKKKLKINCWLASTSWFTQGCGGAAKGLGWPVQPGDPPAWAQGVSRGGLKGWVQGSQHPLGQPVRSEAGDVGLFFLWVPGGDTAVSWCLSHLGWLRQVPLHPWIFVVGRMFRSSISRKCMFWQWGKGLAQNPKSQRVA